jgi:hypothetical protein
MSAAQMSPPFGLAQLGNAASADDFHFQTLPSLDSARLTLAPVATTTYFFVVLRTLGSPTVCFQSSGIGFIANAAGTMKASTSATATARRRWNRPVRGDPGRSGRMGLFRSTSSTRQNGL